MLGGSVGMTPSEKAPPKVRGPLHKADSRRGAAFGLGVLKRRLNNGDQKASEPATVGGRYVHRATAKMARLTRRYQGGMLGARFGKLALHARGAPGKPQRRPRRSAAATF